MPPSRLVAAGGALRNTFQATIAHSPSSPVFLSLASLRLQGNCMPSLSCESPRLRCRNYHNTSTRRDVHDDDGVQRWSSGNDLARTTTSSLDPATRSAFPRLRSRTLYHSAPGHADLSSFAYDGLAEKRAAALASLNKLFTQAHGPVAAMHLLEPYKKSNMECLKHLQEVMEQHKQQYNGVEELKAQYLKGMKTLDVFIAFLWVQIAVWGGALLWLKLKEWDVIEQGDNEVA